MPRQFAGNDGVERLPAKFSQFFRRVWGNLEAFFEDSRNRVDRGKCLQALNLIDWINRVQEGLKGSNMMLHVRTVRALHPTSDVITLIVADFHL